MKKDKKFKTTKESWEQFNFETPNGQLIRKEYWDAINALRELATRFDRDELMDEVQRDV